MGSMPAFDLNSTSNKHTKDIRREPWTCVIAASQTENISFFFIFMHNGFFRGFICA